MNKLFTLILLINHIGLSFLILLNELVRKYDYNFLINSAANLTQVCAPDTDNFPNKSVYELEKCIALHKERLNFTLYIIVTNNFTGNYV